MYSTVGGKLSARIFIVARISIPAGWSTPASAGIAVTMNASVGGNASMSVLVGDGGEVVAMSGHTLAATSESVDGMKPVDLTMSADGAVSVVGSDPALQGLCADGRNLVK